MSLFDFLFKNRPKEPAERYEGIFKMLNGYTPRFTNREGGVYESELIRAAINARATHVSKLKVEIEGAARPALQNKLKHGPNQFQTWSQFMYRLSTLLDVHNTAFITPVFDEYGEPSGVYTPLPSRCEIVQYGDVPYLRYEFSDRNKAAIELAYCGIMTKYQYHSDFMGESNHALFPTMDLIHMQKERQRFTAENFAKDGGGLLLFPNTYQNIKQVEVKPWVVDADQMGVIRANVFEYFGVNEDVLQNKTFGDAWSAFYEGAIEPFAIQFSEVMTKMLFTFREQSQGNRVMATANRLQYMSNQDKLNVSSQLLDRGILSLNDVRDIWNMPPVEGGDVRIIRGEYYNAAERMEETDGE